MWPSYLWYVYYDPPIPHPTRNGAMQAGISGYCQEAADALRKIENAAHPNVSYIGLQKQWADAHDPALLRYPEKRKGE